MSCDRFEHHPKTSSGNTTKSMSLSFTASLSYTEMLPRQQMSSKPLALSILRSSVEVPFLTHTSRGVLHSHDTSNTDHHHPKLEHTVPARLLPYPQLPPQNLTHTNPEHFSPPLSITSLTAWIASQRPWGTAVGVSVRRHSAVPHGL